MYTIAYNTNLWVDVKNHLTSSYDYLPSPIYIPEINQYNLPSNFDDDPITPEEEIDLKLSQSDYQNGRYISFTSDTPRKDIMKFLDSL